MFPDDLLSNDLLLDLQAIGAVATALCTVALVWATFVLAKETKTLYEATTQAHIIVTLEPNQWAANYFDIVVENCGKSAAYDVTIAFSPELPQESSTGKPRDVPFQKLSVLRPGHRLVSSLASFADLKGTEFDVSINWRQAPRAKKTKNFSYQLSMLDYENVSYLGARSAHTQIAEEMKRIREKFAKM